MAAVLAAIADKNATACGCAHAQLRSRKTIQAESRCSNPRRRQQKRAYSVKRDAAKPQVGHRDAPPETVAQRDPVRR